MKCSMTFVFTLFASIILGGTHHAWATGGIECSGISESADVSLVLGAGPVPNIISLRASAGGTQLTTQAGEPGTTVFIAQAFDDGEFLRIDLVDDQATEQVAAIRIIRADDKSGPLQVGFIHVHGQAPATILCEGP